jgi:hypothetical protein
MAIDYRYDGCDLPNIKHSNPFTCSLHCLGKYCERTKLGHSKAQWAF